MAGKVKIIEPSQLRNPVFFTEGDQIQQKLCYISKKALENKIKLVMLLSNQLVIPSSHVCESEITRSVFLENPELLGKSIFTVSVRRGETGFRDHVLSRRDESSFYFDYHNPALEAAVEALDDALHTAVVRNHTVQSAAFQRSVISDLLNNNSSLAKRMRIGVSTRYELAHQIGRLAQLSRDDIAILSQPLSERARRALIKHTNALYYLCGARWNESDPEVHPTSVPIYQDTFDRSISRYSERLFGAVFRGLGLRQDLLDKLSIQDVIQLRDDETVRRFRQAYLNLLDEVRTGQMEKVEELMEASASGEPIRLDDRTLESSVLEALGRKALAEHERIEKRDRIKRLWTLTSFSTSLISAISSLVAPPVAGVAAVAGGVSALAGMINMFTGLTEPLIDYLFKLQPTEFLLFSAHLIQSRKSTLE